MAHKKFIGNPLGVRLSKKESLLIPLQEPEERVPACFLRDLYGSVSKGQGGKGLLPPSCQSRGLAADLPSWPILGSSFSGLAGDLDNSPRFRLPWSLYY